MPPAPADPYNCADGFANWQAGWSVPKKEWCCRVHGKGCPGQAAGGGAPVGTTSAPYDCNAGFANWMAGRMECAEEGVVLQSSWEGLPRSSGGRVCPSGDHLCALRLQCRIRKLDGRVVCSQEGVVLP